jgi:hypothetical protein
MYNMVMYYCVLIVFSLHRESLKLILTTNPFRSGSQTSGAAVLSRRSQHGRDEPAGAGSGNVVKVVRQPHIFPIQLPELILEEG